MDAVTIAELRGKGVEHNRSRRRWDVLKRVLAGSEILPRRVAGGQHKSLRGRIR
ncbi:hypothetical protein FRUB_06644 [Fimbriiglobus ruber]|uniref:Uncharacterized protein n=1 Tax=Fimbriiglobus ruber TaxID=1908690 RepID=A0A225DD07_9BACT|nr:hypothetical protein FRUB_06644 [Fimbriiglobus ruber]